jgi:zinc protease
LTPSFPQINFKHFTLPNGLKVLLHQDKKIPVVTVQTMFHVGSKDEAENKSGLAHLFEHLMFEGSPNIPAGQFDVLLNQRGGDSNAYTTWDVTSYHLTLPSQEFEFGLWLDTDRYYGFNINETELETQKKVVHEEKMTHIDNSPYGSLEEESVKRLFTISGYRRPIIGYMDDVKNLTLKDLKDFFEKNYSANNTVLSISGDIDYDNATELVHKYYSNLKGSNSLNKQSYIEKEITGEIRDVIYDNIQLPAVFMMYRIPKFGSKEWYSFKLIAKILADGDSSFLNKALVYDTQMLNEIFIQAMGVEDVGIFSINGFLDLNSNPDKVINEIDKYVNKMRTGDFSDEHLSKAKNKLETDLYKTNYLQKNISDKLCYYSTVLDNPDLINTEIKKYLNVTKDEIVEMSNKYLDNSKRVILTYLPKD